MANPTLSNPIISRSTTSKPTIFEPSEKDKEIVIKLATLGPLSGYDFHLGGIKRGNKKPLMSTDTWKRRKDKLLQAEIIKPIQPIKKPGRPPKQTKRAKILYWLTEVKGTCLALSLGCNPQRLKEIWNEIYGQDEYANAIFDTVSCIPEEHRGFLWNVANQTKPDLKQFLELILRYSLTTLNWTNIIAMFQILRNYPNATKMVQKTIKKTRKKLKELLSILTNKRRIIRTSTYRRLGNG